MTRHDQPGERPPIGGPTLIAGRTWYRRRIRTLGPLLGLVPMAALGGLAWLALRLSDGTASGIAGLLGGVSAAPGLLVVGAPFADNGQYPMAVVASIPLWIVLGLIAAFRATARPVASWRDYWREMTWMTIAVIVGSVAAIAAATLVLGESLVF
jgi:hypothetical protein